ncbi:hypothetical protein MARINON1_51473 [Marinobacter salarius]|nr:hypothetical protein MBHK15_130138 [Marinobacter salarius]VXB86334.1 hypothetical protein MARINON1_51473 [Marinobacter salarius]
MSVVRFRLRAPLRILTKPAIVRALLFLPPYFCSAGLNETGAFFSPNPNACCHTRENTCFYPLPLHPHNC